MSANVAMKFEVVDHDCPSVPVDVPVLRQADGSDACVESPVHQLQAELLLNALPPRSMPLSELVIATHDEMVPGWLRLALPVVLSLVLWAMIFRMAALLG